MRDFVVENLTLRDFRGYQNLSLDFENDLTILVGINGSGKTSIIDALRLLFSGVLSTFRSSDTPAGENPTQGITAYPSDLERDIRRGSTRAIVESTLAYRNDHYRLFTHLRPWFEDSLELEYENDTLSFRNTLLMQIREEHLGESDIGLPVIASYGILRNAIDVPARIRTPHNFTPIETYDQSLESSTAFRLFFEWYRLMEDLENENLRWNEPGQFSHSVLDTIRMAFEKNLPGFSNFRISRSPSAFLVDKNGTTLSINQLSDGERSLLALIGDIARRLCIANPHMSNPLLGGGIVLIDEIDLHLHPQWQERIIPSLVNTFPSIQFIVTTHSPQVLSTVHRRHIRLLNMDETVSIPEATWGMTATEILEDIMGAQPIAPEVQDRLIKLEKLITEGDLEAAQRAIQQLKHDAGTLPPSALALQHTLDFKKYISDASDQKN